MTDLAVTTIRSALNGLPAGTRWTVDDFRPAAEAAQLRPHEINAAIRWAVTHGWLRPIRAEYGYVCQPTRHGPAKGRMVQVYRRTTRVMGCSACDQGERAEDARREGSE